MADFWYDRDKFRELVLYISGQCAEDEFFGDTKLNKVLFFADAFALQYLGEPITGARYQKLPWGPAPRALIPVRDELIEEGDAQIEKHGKAPYLRTVTVPLRAADTSLFTEDELNLVNKVIALLDGKSAVRVSEESHLNSPGWNLVDMNEDIPLESQLLSRKPHPPEVLARGRELAARFNW